MTALSAPLLPPDPTRRDGSAWSVYRTVEDIDEEVADIDVVYHIDGDGNVWWACVQAQTDGTLRYTDADQIEPMDDVEIMRRFS